MYVVGEIWLNFSLQLNLVSPGTNQSNIHTVVFSVSSSKKMCGWNYPTLEARNYTVTTDNKFHGWEETTRAPLNLTQCVRKEFMSTQDLFPSVFMTYLTRQKDFILHT